MADAMILFAGTTGLSLNFRKVSAERQPTCAKITSEGTSLCFALDAAAAHVLWAENL